MSTSASPAAGPTRSISRRAFAQIAGATAMGMLSACGGQEQQGDGAGTPATGTVDAPAPVASVRTSLFSVVTLADEQAFAPKASSYSIDGGLAGVDVADSLYLTDEARQLLGKQGFAVMKGYADEFWPVYEDNRYNQRPNLVTVDSMMHSYHLYFQYLLKKIEGGVLFSALQRMSEALLAASEAQLTSLAGTEWESAATRALTFFGVGCSLLDSAATVPQEVAATVADEVAHIEQAGGNANSAVTGQPLDYTQFIVRGYYEETETLKRYFRAMMWYGQLSFVQREEDLDRTALLITLALDEAARDDWQALYAVTSFFVGAADDNGYYEYLPALQQIYGEGVQAADLAGNDEAWQQFHALTGQMPAPQINSLPGSSAKDNEADRGFRFMGQRFTVDAHIFQQLIYNNVSDASDGARRLLPSALDVPAALGSAAAFSILDHDPDSRVSAYGSTRFPGYTENLEQLKADVAAKDDSFWQASLYNQWLHALRPLLEEKGDGYPTFMQGEAWALHGLESFLGSYTELKHDTILYAKQAMAEGDGPIPEERDDRGYVEAEPRLFDRLGRLCSATMQGLAHFGLIDGQDFDDLDILRQLADKLTVIAGKELADELPTEAEFELIRSIGEQLEHFWRQVHEEEAERLNLPLATMQFPAALVADVATGGNECLELGTGKVSTLYAVVPVDGTLRVASGPVFTFHEFAWPTADRLTDTKWREMVRDSYYSPTEATETEPWTAGFRIAQDY